VVLFKLIRDVKRPQYSSSGAAALDFYVPNDVEWESKTLRPGESVNIPSGIKVQHMNPGICMIALNKSSKGVQGLLMGAQLVDPDYRGEIHLNVVNTSQKEIVINRGEKLIQFIVVPFNRIEPQFTEDESNYTITERGHGAFGSTGTH
jgi:dUTP pyrophosphatase